MDSPVEPRELTDGSIALRLYTAQDAGALYEAARESIPEAGPWLPWCGSEYSMENAADWCGERGALWEAGIEYSFAIFDAGDGRFLGGIGLNKIDRLNRSANLGYWVRSSAAGRGIATAASRMVARFAFERLGLIRVEILAAVGNTASRRVAVKAGAVAEGVLRNRLLLHGIPHDAVMHSILPP